MKMGHHDNVLTNLGFRVITVSDTRTEADDLSGALIRTKMASAGHVIRGSVIVPDEVEAISAALRKALEDEGTDLILITGGSGIAPRDVTVEAISPFLEKELPGFGELFRALSYREVGTRAMLSRAHAGISQGKAIFCLPGSKNAVGLSLESLIIPEIGHILWEARR